MGNTINERITKTLIKQHTPPKMKPTPPIQTALNYAKLREGLSNPSLAEVAKRFGVRRNKYSASYVVAIEIV